MGRHRAFRPHPGKPRVVYDIVADVGSTEDLAATQPDLVERFERIFKEARFDSEWYVNPGETDEQVNAKRKRAEQAGQIIRLVAPNASSKSS